MKVTPPHDRMPKQGLRGVAVASAVGVANGRNVHRAEAEPLHP
jgi:hypothetical protein